MSDFLSHPLMGGNLSSWLALLAAHGGRVSPRHAGRALAVTVLTTLLSPMRAAHRLRHGGAAGPARVVAPLFIIGHYRSGTTLLNTLLGCDTRWATVSTAQALLPDLWQFRSIAWLFRRVLPPTRPMDNMAMSPELPEEPEHAMGARGRFCLYHGFCFPRQFAANYAQWVALDERSAHRRREWARRYARLLDEVSRAGGGRPVLVKNPADTGRLGTVLEAFPDARFVFLVRDPLSTFASTLKFYRAMVDELALQHVDEPALREIVFETGRALLEGYLRQRERVGAHRLVEVRFEELERDPLGTCAGIYAQLGLPGFEEVRPRMVAHLATQAGYRKNVFTHAAADVDEVRARWGALFARWGYALPTRPVAGLGDPLRHDERAHMAHIA